MTKGRLWICGGIFLLALTVRLVYLYESGENPSFTAPIVDSGTYDEMAREFAGGKGMSRNFFWQPFFYPLFLSAIYFVVPTVKASIIAAKLVQFLLGGVTCVLSYYLGERIFNRRIGMLAGIITAFYGPLIFFEGELMASGWAAFWTVVLVLLLVKAGQERRLRLCLFLGLSGGLSIINRPEFLPFFGVGLIWLTVVFLRGRAAGRESLLLVGTVIAGLVLVLVPVSLLNKRVTGHWGFLPASGGINFYLGNNPEYARTLTARPGWGWEEITSLPEKNGVKGDMWQQQRFFKAKVKDYILTQPGSFAWGMLRKTGQFINSREIPRNVNIYVMSGWSGILKLLAWRLDGFGFPFGVLLPAALLGLVYYRRQIPGPVWLFVIFYPSAIILVFVTARYRVPIAPVMSILAAAGVSSLIEMIRRHRRKDILLTMAAGAVVVMFSVVPGSFPEEEPNYEAELYANVGDVLARRGQLDEAMQLYHRALALEPEYPILFANLAAVLIKQGKVDEAMAYAGKAMAYKTDSPELHNSMATVLAGLGKIEQAEEHYRRALQLQSDYAEAYFNYGNLKAALGQNEQAIKLYQAAIEYKPDYFKAYNALALIFIGEGDFAQAISYYEKTVRLEPSNPNAHGNLGLALLKTGRIEEAVKEFREALKLFPDAPVLLIQLARILIITDRAGVYDPEEAVWLALRACELTGYQDPESLDTLAAAYAATGKFAEAVQTAQKAADLAQAANNPQLAAEIRLRLNLYKAGKTYRRPQLQDQPADNSGIPKQ